MKDAGEKLHSCHRQLARPGHVDHSGVQSRLRCVSRSSREAAPFLLGAEQFPANARPTGGVSILLMRAGKGILPFPLGETPFNLTKSAAPGLMVGRCFHKNERVAINGVRPAGLPSQRRCFGWRPWPLRSAWAPGRRVSSGHLHLLARRSLSPSASIRPPGHH